MTDPDTTRSQNPIVGRKAYVFAVVASVAFLIGCCFFNRHTNTRITQSSIALLVNADCDQAWVRELLIDTVREVTSDSQLATTISQVTRECIGENPLIIDQDIPKIRERLRITSSDQDSGHLNVAISLTGIGTPDEQSLVNHIANRLASELPRQGIRMAMQSLNNAPPSQTIAQLANSTSRELDLITNSIRSAQIQLENLQSSVEEVNGRSSVVAEINPVWTQLNSEIEILRAAKKRLMEQRELPEAHPDVVKIQQQIESKSFTLSGIQRRVAGKAVQGAEDRRVDNRFFNVSNRVDSDRTIDDVALELRSINLNSVANATTRLRDQLQQPPAADTPAINEHALINSTPSMHSIEYADGSVAMRSGNPTRYGWALIFSIALASVVTWRYNPQLDVPRFRSVADVARKLNVPIVGTLIENGRSPESGKHSIDMGIIRAFEYMGIALMVLVALGCMFDKNIFASVIETPSYAFTRILWIVFG